MMTALDPVQKKRRSRMHRASTGKRIELTDRDLEIFRLLTRYRYLRSTYIHAFVGGNKTKLIERLGHLYHEGGYLDRPDQQWEAVNARYVPVAYELGERGRCALADTGLAVSPRTSRARQYRHEALICDIVASIELESSALPGLRFISWEEILRSPKMPAATLDSGNPRAVPLRSTGEPANSVGETLLVPDAIFGLEYEWGGKGSFRFFALEADRNTEPAIRRNSDESSFVRKIAQYQDVICRSLYRSRWGLPNLLVLTVTTSDRHKNVLLGAAQRFVTAEVAKHFLFRSISHGLAGESAGRPIPGFLTVPWQRPAVEALALA